MNTNETDLNETIKSAANYSAKAAVAAILGLACIGGYQCQRTIAGTDVKEARLEQAQDNIERNAYVLGQDAMKTGKVVSTQTEGMEKTYQKFIRLDKDSAEVYFVDTNNNGRVDPYDRISVSYKNKQGTPDSAPLVGMNARHWMPRDNVVEQADTLLEKLVSKELLF